MQKVSLIYNVQATVNLSTLITLTQCYISIPQENLTILIAGFKVVKKENIGLKRNKTF